MSLSVNLLATIAIELQQGISHQDRFQRLISTLRHVLKCDASALLRYEAQHFRPLAIDGLSPDVPGRRFALNEHPRLEAIARAGISSVSRRTVPCRIPMTDSSPVMKA
ncbi:anaerobic nitric oxide reductase transcription regulator NorR [Atlantibacter hermannii]|nr:anaerobic nitric oxide reductase transcription regulator NorR [Atlantibacter hermannii]